MSRGSVFIIRDKVPYRDLGSYYIDEHQRGRLMRHHVRRLESLGLYVEIHELPQTG